MVTLAFPSGRAVRHGAVELKTIDDAGQWDELVQAHESGTPFHSWTFLTAFSRHWDLRFEPLVVWVDGDAVGVVPRLVRTRIGMKWANDMKVFSYLGPVVADRYVGAVMEALGSIDRLAIVRARQEVRRDPTSMPEVTGWSRRAGTTMVVPLAGRDTDGIAAAASKSFRQSPVRTVKHGLVVEPARERDIAEALPRLVGASYARQGLQTPYGQRTYLEVWREFAARGAAHASVVRDADRVAGVTLTLVAGDRAYGWVTGADPEFRRAEPSMAGQRAEILWAHAAGIEEYDLIGGSTPGIAAFKRSLGGVERPFTIYERGHRV